jgi:hypothetical protein
MSSVVMIKCNYAECCSDECRYAKCHYAECRYAKCHYAECRGAVFGTKYLSQVQ